MPKTILGKWSVWLALAMLILMTLGLTLDSTFYKGVTAGDSIFEDITIRPFLAIPLLIGWIAGIAAFINGLVAIIKKQERAVLVYISTLFGALLILFMIGDAFSAE